MIIKRTMAFKGRPCTNVKRSLLCTSLHTPAVVDTEFGRCGFLVAVMCIMESPWVPLHQTLALNNLCKLKKHSAYKKHTAWHSHTHSLKFIHSSYNKSVQWFRIPLPSLGEVRGYWRKRQQWGKHKNSWDIAQTSAGTEYNSLSFQQPSLCIGRIKHLWCSQTLNPSRKALLYTKVGTTNESRIHNTWQISRVAWRWLNVL